MKPLPAQPYERADWKKARVHLDYHVQVDTHYYSVPYRLLGVEVETRLTAATLEVFHQGQRVASHPRAVRQYAYTTNSEHMPASHRAYAERDVERLFSRARGCGFETEALCRALVADRPHPEQGYRACLGILRLGETHGAARLERACRRALLTGALSYRRLQAILRHHLEDVPLPPEPPVSGAPMQHGNLRGAGYYQDQQDHKPC